MSGERYFKDKKKEIEKIAKWCIKKFFKDRLFDKVKFKFIFWEGERMSKGGTKQILRGETIRPSIRERDIYKIDFIIAISEDFWITASTKLKRLVVAHELDHCVVKEDKENPNTCQYDAHNRPKTAMQPHDLNINTFKADIKRFGPTADLLEAVAVIKSTSKNKKRKTKKMVVKKKKK